jgi:hypothetical protein
MMTEEYGPLSSGSILFDTNITNFITEFSAD